MLGVADFTRVGHSVIPNWERSWSRGSYTSECTNPVVAEGVFWGLVEDDFFVPVELESGEPLWRTRLPDNERMFVGVAVTTELVVLTSLNAVAAFRRKDGSTAWAHTTDARAHFIDDTGATLLVERERIFIAQGRGIVCRALEDGRVLWSTAVDAPRACLGIGDRLFVPARDALVVLDKVSGAVVARREGPCAFALAFEADQPLVLASHGSFGLQVLDLEARARCDFQLESFLTETEDGWAPGRGIMGLAVGAAVCGTALFGGSQDLGAWFRLDLSGGAQRPPVMTHQGRYRQYRTFASNGAQVFACEYASAYVDVFDPALRRLGSLETGVPRGRFLVPRILPTSDGGLVFAAGDVVTAFARTEPDRSVLAPRPTPPLSAKVLAQLERLGARSRADARQRPLPLPLALSTFLDTQWPQGVRFRIGVPRTQLHWDGGWLLEPGLVTDFKGPLMSIAFSERTQTHHAVAVSDETDDPLVFDVSHAGGEPLSLGTRLSRFLEGVTALN